MGNLLITPENTSLSLGQHLSAQPRPDTCSQVAQRQGSLTVNSCHGWLKSRGRGRGRGRVLRLLICAYLSKPLATKFNCSAPRIEPGPCASPPDCRASTFSCCEQVTLFQKSTTLIYTNCSSPRRRQGLYNEASCGTQNQGVFGRLLAVRPKSDGIAYSR